MSRTIEILVRPGGGIEIEAKGFRGPDCEAATKFIEDALGRTVSRRRKPEFNAQGLARQSIGGKGGR